MGRGGDLRRDQALLKGTAVDPIETITGDVSFLDRANVDTDQIMPKQFLKRVERSGFGEFLFYDWAKEPGWDLPANPILVAGENFGCGSSREHAPWGLQDYGFQAIVAPSFADIFYSNCTKIGLLPIVLGEEDCRALAHAGHGQVDLAAQEVRFENREVSFEIDHEIRRRLLEGLDDIGVTLSAEAQITDFEAEREQAAAWQPVATTAL
jgi:3-isopropylmalate/(R)-2-methylmalate dehydratase small subunit